MRDTLPNFSPEPKPTEGVASPVSPQPSGSLGPLESDANPDPQSIGPYRILERVGCGGFGEVYKAERRHPMRQTVAIKVIKLGYDTREIIARFNSERQALARMDHPHIARVLDAGTTESGRPYFVMEHVPGVPITRFCDDNKLSIKERLLLFTQVCGAIAHAHTKALIHRDIKSGNVLAYLHDGKPTVKVIDFGIAKALTGDRLTEQTFNTERGQVIGTYEAMSPEQAEGSPDIDTRTDVYSLGVLLYELLSGAKPFDSQTLLKAADHEIRRIIREVEPPRPSTRLSKLGPAAAKIAKLRREQLEDLAKQLRGELEWIPLKAMRKERDRRYATVQQICKDIQNYLEHRPLVAAPESHVYRIRKFVRRNKGPVLATSAILLLIALGVVGTAIGFVHAERTRQAGKLQRMRDLSALVAKTNDTALLLRQSGNLSQAEANLREATEHAREELGPDDPTTLSLTNNLALLLREGGKLAEAQSLHRDVLARRRQTLGSEHADTLFSLTNLGALLLAEGKLDEAAALLSEAVAIHQKTSGPDHAQTLTAMNNMAALLRLQGKLADAELMYRDVLDRRRRSLGEDDTETLISMNSLGALLRDRKRFPEAEQLLRDSLARRKSRFGDDHPDTIMSMHDVGMLLRSQGKLADAEPFFREALRRRRRVLGQRHPDTLGSAYVLARLLEQTDRCAEAEPLYDELFQQAAAAQIPQRMIAVYMSGLGRSLVAIGRYTDAEQPLREAHRRLKETAQQAHPAMREVVAAFVTLFEKTNRPEEAATWRLELEKLQSGSRQPAGPSTVPVASAEGSG